MTMSDLHLQSSMMCLHELVRCNRQKDFKDEWLHLQLRWALEARLKVKASEMVLQTKDDKLLVMRRDKQHEAPLLVLPMHGSDSRTPSCASSSDANSFSDCLERRGSGEISCWREMLEQQSKVLEEERREQQAALQHWLQQADQFKRIARKLHPYADDETCGRLAAQASDNWRKLHKAAKVANDCQLKATKIANISVTRALRGLEEVVRKPPSTISQCSFESEPPASPLAVDSTPPLSPRAISSPRECEVATARAEFVETPVDVVSVQA